MAKPSYEELQKKVEELEKKSNGGPIRFKVSDKGGVSVYGLGRFPVTLYYEQWTRLISMVPDLSKFIAANKSKLKLKD